MSTPTPAPADKKAVAQEPVSTAGLAPGPDVCADCGSDKVVAHTDGLSAERRCFCARHRPVNVPLAE